MKKFIYTFLVSLLSFATFAQDTTATPPAHAATGLYASGKIYVVIAIVVTILLGLILYVFRLDRKLTKLEKDNL